MSTLGAEGVCPYNGGILLGSDELYSPHGYLTLEYCKIVYALGTINYKIMLVARKHCADGYNLPSSYHAACTVHHSSLAIISFHLEGSYAYYFSSAHFINNKSLFADTVAYTNTRSAGGA